MPFLSEPCYYSWRRKLRTRQSAERESQRECGVPGLLPVKVVQAPTGAAHSLDMAHLGRASENVVRDSSGALPAACDSVEIATPGGFVLRVREAIENRCLHSLLQTVVGVERGGEPC